MEPFAVQGIWDSYRDKNLSRELLLAYGYGDGGGGVNREHLEMRRRLDAIPGVPNVKPGRADDYFERLNETIRSTDQYVHTWDGELYLEYHRGTYTSQAYNKKMNRRLELLYREAEWLQVLLAAESGSFERYPKQELDEGWKIILRNQFHDIIPGSSIREVYEDSRTEYAEAEEIGNQAVRAAAEALTGFSDQGTSKKVYTVFNGAFFDQTGLLNVTAEDSEHREWRDEHGSVLRAQQLDNGWLIEAPEIPMLATAVISAVFTDNVEPAALKDSFIWENSILTTPHYIMEWNKSGQLSRLYDRDADREVLAPGECGNVLQVFEDKPKQYDAWDIDLYYQEKKREITGLVSIELVESGPLAAVLQFSWKYMDSTVIQKVKVYAGSRRIDFETLVDWHEQHQLLKAAFPVNVRSTEATYDIQYGNVKRPTHWNTSWDYARFESVGHQWADLSERGYGVSLLNDCKYGYDIKDHVIRLSLIKSATAPDWQADQGEHRFTYSLLPHEGDWAESRTAEEAWMLNNPLRVEQGSFNGATGKSLFRTDAAGVAIDAVKWSEQGDSCVIRLHEFFGGRRKVKLGSGYPVHSWQLCDLMERPQGGVTSGGEIELEFKPYEIHTLLIKFFE